MAGIKPRVERPKEKKVETKRNRVDVMNGSIVCCKVDLNLMKFY